MVCPEDTNIRQGFQADPEVNKSKVFVRRTDTDSTRVSDDRFFARLPPKACVGKNHPVAGFPDELRTL